MLERDEGDLGKLITVANKTGFVHWGLLGGLDDDIHGIARAYLLHSIIELFQFKEIGYLDKK